MTPEAQRIAIAEQCGWKKREDRVSGYYLNLPDGSVINRCDRPPYLADVNCALDLCDLMAERGWNCELNNGLDKTWECTFYRPFNENTHRDNVGHRDGISTEEHYGCGDKMGVAICQAFLRANEKWIE